MQEAPSAKAEGKPREDFIVTIDRSDDNTAFIKVRCQLPPRYFTDYLVAMKLSDGWKIVSKSYRYDLRDKICSGLRPRRRRLRAAVAAAKIAADHAHHDRRVQQPRRRRLEIGDLAESGRQLCVVARGHVQLADIPVDEA